MFLFYKAYGARYSGTRNNGTLNPRSQEEADFCEFKASLVYMASYMRAMATQTLSQKKKNHMVPKPSQVIALPAVVKNLALPPAVVLLLWRSCLMVPSWALYSVWAPYRQDCVRSPVAAKGSDDVCLAVEPCLSFQVLLQSDPVTLPSSRRACK